MTLPASSLYLRHATDLKLRKHTINQCVKSLRGYCDRHEVDAIVLRGLSGLLIGPEVCSRLKIPFIIIRKSVNTHGHPEIEIPPNFTLDRFRFLILDDFVSTGRTVATILRMMYKWFPHSTLVAMYQWDRSQKYINGKTLVHQIRYRFSAEIGAHIRKHHREWQFYDKKKNFEVELSSVFNHWG